MAELRDGPAQNRKVDVLRPREKLSDGDIGNLLAAFGNHEAKAVTLLAMRGGPNAPIYSGSELYKRVLEVQGDKPGWRTSHKSGIQFCHFSLAPIGLVVKEELSSEGTFGYRLTNQGEHAKLFAALLLEFSERHREVSLLELFGQTPGPKKTNGEVEKERSKRAPSIRYNIFKTLISQDPPTRAIDLAGILGESKSVIGGHLENLRNLGLIQYESTAQGSKKPYVYYTVNQNNTQDLTDTSDSRYPRILAEIYGIGRSYGTVRFGREEIYQELVKINPKYAQRSKKFMENAISRSFTYLAAQDKLTTVQFDLGTQSEITLTPNQKGFFKELVDMVEGYRRGDKDVIDYAKKTIGELLENPHRIANLMKKAHDHSHHTNEAGITDFKNEIVSLIKSNPGITTAELRIKLAKKNIKKDSTRIQTVIRDLEKEKVISSIKEGLQRHFSVTEEVSESSELETVGS